MVLPAPTLHVLVTFSGSTETDLVEDVLRCTITRGRARERETMSPGRADVELWNRSGDYDPDNASGPFFGDIRPNKIGRILADVPSGTSPFTIGQSAVGGGDAFGGGGDSQVTLFTGRLEGVTLSYEEGGLQPKVTWRFVDASKRLNRDRSTTGFGASGDLTGARVAAVLDGATPVWPAGERIIAAGTRTLQASTGNAGRYDYMLQVAASEFGAFFISKDGWAVFRDSTYAPTPATPLLGSGGGEYVFSDIEITDEDQEIFNAVTVTANALADQVAEDTASQAEFGRADLPVSTILDSIADMADIATSLVNAYSQPRRRISRLHVDRAAADWNFFLSRELQERVTVRHRPVYGGTFEQESVIQGIQVAIAGGQWDVTWNLTPPISVISNPNLLTENQSSMETSAAGWTVTSGDLSITGLAAAAIPYVGAYCLEAHTDPSLYAGELTTTPYTTAPVVVGETYRASAWIRSYWASALSTVYIDWRNSGGTILSQAAGSPDGPFYASSTEWQYNSVTGVAPASAAYATVTVHLTDALGEAHPVYMDAVELRHIGA